MNKLDLTKCEQGQLFYARLQTGYDYGSAYLVGIIVGIPTKMVFAFLKMISTIDDITQACQRLDYQHHNSIQKQFVIAYYFKKEHDC